MEKVQSTPLQDKRVRKTRYLITHTLADILTEKSLNKITVTELCQRANINRKTFYMHFDSVEDAFEYIIVCINDGFYEIQKKHNTAKGYCLRDSVNEQLMRLDMDLEYYHKLAEGTESDRIFNKILEGMEKARLPFTSSSESQRDMVRYTLRFLNSAYLITVMDWLRSPNGRTYQEVSKFYLEAALRVRDIYKIDVIVDK